MNKAYPWLLGISTCLSGVFCWMYVTKPVQIVSSETSTPVQEIVGKGSENSASTGVKSVSSDRGRSDLLPSDDSLPGMTPAGGASSKPSSRRATPKAVDPREIIAAGDGSGWETTNARVQHILSADAGNGEVTKIVLNVPVLYQTRTMRWTPTDVQKARDVLTRLMVYENNLSKLKQEGQALLVDWNQLLEKTVPAPSLRADSPSLPYNHSRQSGGNLPGSGSTIKIEQ